MDQQLYEAHNDSSIHHSYKPDGSKEKINSILRGPHKDIWKKIISNKWGQLPLDNVHGVTSTYTIEFISKSDVPLGQATTYASFVL